MAKPRRRQVSPVIALVVIAVAVIVVGVLFWRGLQPKRYSRDEMLPTKAYLELMSRARGGGSRTPMGTSSQGNAREGGQPGTDADQRHGGGR